MLPTLPSIPRCKIRMSHQGHVAMEALRDALVTANLALLLLIPPLALAQEHTTTASGEFRKSLLSHLLLTRRPAAVQSRRRPAPFLRLRRRRNNLPPGRRTRSALCDGPLGRSHDLLSSALGAALSPATVSIAQKEIQRAQQIGSANERERQFIHALSLIYQDPATVPYPIRASNYEQAMGELAAANTRDLEAQVFYALALLANASPSDKTHARRNKRPLCSSRSIAPILTTPESPTTSSTPATTQNSHQKVFPPPEPTPHIRSLSAARLAHALAHLYPARPLGRLHRLQPCRPAFRPPARRHKRRTPRHGLSCVRLPPDWPRQRSSPDYSAT